MSSDIVKFKHRYRHVTHFAICDTGLLHLQVSLQKNTFQSAYLQSRYIVWKVTVLGHCPFYLQQWNIWPYSLINKIVQVMKEYVSLLCVLISLSPPSAWLSCVWRHPYITLTLGEQKEGGTRSSVTTCFLFSRACVCSIEKLPVEAKLPWYKQAQELEEGTALSEEPS